MGETHVTPQSEEVDQNTTVVATQEAPIDPPGASTEEATRWWLSLTPEQEDSMIRFLAGLPTWSRATTPRGLAALLVDKLFQQEGAEGAMEILKGSAIKGVA